MPPLDAALELSKRGWPVFPCSPDDKRPLTKQGFKDASTDPSTIAAWWRRWPDAMIGVPTGHAIGAFVVDIDPAPGVNPAAVLDELARVAGCGLPDTPLSATPRGGLHVWFAMPASPVIGNRAGLLNKHGTPGVDIRGEGGYVIVPPSMRRGPKAKREGCDGKPYRWLAGDGDGIALPDAPEALLRLIARLDEPSADAPPAPSPPPPADSRARRYALSALDAETRAVAQAPPGTRNSALNDAALKMGSLVASGALVESVVRAALEDAARASGLARDDGIRSVRATIESGLKAGLAAPRNLAGVGRNPVAPQGAAAHRTQPSQPGNGDAAPPSGPGGGDVGDDDPPPELLAACAKLDQNDTGNGARLLAHFGEDMLWVRDIGPHVWCGSHWEYGGADEAFIRFAQRAAARIRLEDEYLDYTADEAEAIEAAKDIDTDVLAIDGRKASDEDRKRKAKARAAVARAEAAAGSLAERRASRRRFSISSGNTQRINGMLAQAAAHHTVTPDLLDAEKLAINVRNGTLRLIKEKTREIDPDCPDPNVTRWIDVTRWRVRRDPHRRADRISKIMPVEYEPAADCPKFRAFMERFQPNEAIRDFLQRFHGYALTGLTGEQVFPFNYGLGANGKTTFIETMALMQGSYAYLLPAEAVTGDTQRRGDQATPEFARLPGARLVRCAELPPGQSLREGTIKLLTGGEPLLVRHLHQRFFEFRPVFKAIGSGNTKPYIGGVDEGIWRRVLLVPWTVTIPKPERRPMAAVLSGFMAEASGILNWLLQGLIDYLEHGLRIPPEIQEATEEYRADMDPVGEFARSCVQPQPGQNVTARSMYDAYVSWCAANSVRPRAERKFAEIMGDKGFRKKLGRVREYLDVCLVNVPTDPAPERASGYQQQGEGEWR